ncbi:TRAP transporter substrate-binding protein [Zobellella aerophila]|uniref:2,3-diketo-L-gulonate transporter substrate-binding protein YiaO n=1 Tax=Zobellella aerophila TaxID=870480 RepID=A0ABP6VZ02_9GAMM
MKRSLISASTLALALLAGSAQAAEFELKLGHVANEDNSWHQAFEKFAELVEQKSAGRLEIQLYPNSQLGNETDLINGIQLGIVDMTMSGETLQNWAPKAALLAVPYALRDSAHLQQVAGGELGREVEQQITERTGLVPLTWFERGARELTSNKPVKTPEDLKGMIVRVPNVPLFVSAWQAMGAKPTPMAFGEVFTSLQQGAIHAQENPLSLIDSASFFEVQKYVNRTDHVRSWIYVLIGKRQLEQLPEELQQILMESAKEMQAYERTLFTQAEAELEAKLKEKGMEFVDVDQAAFKAKALEAVRKTLDAEQLELFNKIQAI